MANPLRLLRPDPTEERRRNLLRLVQPDQEPLAPPTNPLRAALTGSDEIQPDFRSGGDTSPTTNLPEIPLSARSDGRPTRDRNLLDRSTRESDYQDQLEEYKPQNESLGKTVLRSALGFLGAGPAGAVAPLLTRNRADERWRNQELVRSEDRQDRGNALRRAGLQEDLMRSQTAENDAQATRDRTHFDWFPQDTDGDGIPDNEVYSPVRPGASKQIFRKAVTEGNPMVVETKNADGSTTRKLSFDHGKTWEVGEGLGDAALPEKASGEFNNRQLQGNIKAAELERDGIWQTLKDNNIQPTMPGATEGQTIANPIYQEYIQRGRKLDDDIRDWKARMKPEGVSRGGTDPLQGVKWSKSKYRGSKSIEQAAQEAKARGAIIID